MAGLGAAAQLEDGTTVRRQPGLQCYGSMHRTAGLLASVLGRWGDAEEHFAAAFAANERLGARPWTARAQYDWACMLLARRGPGDVERAVDLLHTARITARGLGMVRVLEGIDVTLRIAQSAPSTQSDE